MSGAVIKAENLGKRYFIGHRKSGGYKTFREQISEGAERLFSRTQKGFKSSGVRVSEEIEEFWALKELNFEIRKGDRLGIIGRNGAGKSTLLKVLSRITEPTTGRLSIKGRVASLLEVGTGFHPELSGRENIFLNGAVLGMSRSEIKRKFDEIVDFSGVEKFLDTPVKRYSSGMYVRLAFSVAAHLEPEILVVDEVLAVGDAEFQKKCLGKMDSVSKQGGRTILFVSHNMAAIQNLCNISLVLSKGQIQLPACNTEKAISFYLENFMTVGSKTEIASRKDREGLGQIKISEFQKTNEQGVPQDLFVTGQSIYFKIYFETTAPMGWLNMTSALSLTTSDGLIISVFNTELNKPDNIKTNQQKGCIVCCVEKLPVTAGMYSINLIIRNNGIIQDWIQDVDILDVENGDFFGIGRPEKADPKTVLIAQKWYLES